MKGPKRFIHALALIIFWSQMLRVISELPKFLSSAYVTEYNEMPYICYQFLTECLRIDYLQQKHMPLVLNYSDSHSAVITL